MRDLAFDPNAVLSRAPGSLLERHFLSTLYTELETLHGADEAALVLLQIGFL